MFHLKFVACLVGFASSTLAMGTNVPHEEIMCLMKGCLPFSGLAFTSQPLLAEPHSLASFQNVVRLHAKTCDFGVIQLPGYSTLLSIVLLVSCPFCPFCHA